MTFAVRLVARKYRSRALDSPQSTDLPGDEVHVWHWEPVSSSAQVSGLWEILPEDERRRAQRFLSTGHRDEFVVNRATLRILLAGYMADAPERIAFEYSTRGKPSVRNAGGLRFNLSHTAGRAAIALAREREVGIDVERIRSQYDAQKIAQRFFSEQEQKLLQELSGQKLADAFFRCWTRKEAYIKARGEGLSCPLYQFDVSLAEDQPASLMSTRPDPEEAKRWLLYDLPLAAGYAAALAVAAAPLQTP
jgi:4'-phosphopantetheinyl transferase